MAGKASCRQCGGSGVIYKKEQYRDANGKVTTVETPTTCKRCNGSGEER